MKRRYAIARERIESLIGLTLVGVIVWLIVAIAATLLSGCVGGHRFDDGYTAAKEDEYEKVTARHD